MDLLASETAQTKWQVALALDTGSDSLDGLVDQSLGTQVEEQLVVSPVDIVQAGTGIGKLVPAAEASQEVLSFEMLVESRELVLQKPALNSHGFDERLRDDEVAQRVVVFRELLGQHGIETAS